MSHLTLPPAQQKRLNDLVNGEIYPQRFRRDAVVDKTHGYIYCGSTYCGRMGWNEDKACWSFNGIVFDSNSLVFVSARLEEAAAAALDNAKYDEDARTQAEIGRVEQL